MGLLFSEKSLELCLGFKRFAFVIGMDEHLLISTVLPLSRVLELEEGLRKI